MKPDDASENFFDGIDFNWLKPSPRDYHFYDKLLPFAITNKNISATDLIDLWIFVRHHGNDERKLLEVFFNGDVDQAEKALIIKKIESYTDDELLSFLKLPIEFVQDQNLSLKDYSNSNKQAFSEKQLEEEKKVIKNNQIGLYNKFVPSLDKAQLKTLWEKSEEKNRIELMCYYYFLDKYIFQYAQKAILNVDKWPTMVQLKNNILPNYDYDEILKNLILLHDIDHMGYDKSKWTLSDILRFMELLNLIRENRIE